MTQQQTNPWLQLGALLTDLAKQQPPEVQQSLREMSRKTYPEAAHARRERDEEVQQ